MDDEKVIGDIELIKKVMLSCARKQESNGIYFKIWGLLIPVATILDYIIVSAGKGNLIWLLWGITMLTGIVLSIRIARNRKGINTSSLGSKILSAVWINSWISIAAAIVLSIVFNVLPLNALMVFIAFIMAGSFYISGVLGESRILKVSAAGWWITGAAAAFIPLFWSSVLIAVSTFLFSFIPGLLLDRSFNRKNNYEQNES